MSTPVATATVVAVDKRETIAVTLDLSRWFPGESPALTPGTAELVRKSDNQPFASGLFGTMSVSGMLISQTIRNLQEGERYWLIMPVSIVGQTFAPRQAIECLVG
jgi:hypothetical protein